MIEFRIERLMRKPVFKTSDWIVTSVSVALLGASEVVGKDASHNVQVWLFWAGVFGIIWVFVGLVLFPTLFKEAEAKGQNGGIFVAGNNNGTQQVFHGPVTFSGATSISGKKDSREYIAPQVTAARLIANFNGKTELQGQALTKPFIGKWMRVKGRIRNVSDQQSFLHLSFMPGPKQIEHPVSCFFSPSWRDHLHGLKRGDKVEVEGQVGSVASHGISLRNCEIL